MVRDGGPRDLGQVPCDLSQLQAPRVENKAGGVHLQ